MKLRFKFTTFSPFAKRAYSLSGTTQYDIKSVLCVFCFYFAAYEVYGYGVHPAINVSQIQRIIEKMPQIESDAHDFFDVDPDDYKLLIVSYFETDFFKSDRNINHFFSGEIRAMRYYENFY